MFKKSNTITILLLIALFEFSFANYLSPQESIFLESESRTSTVFDENYFKDFWIGTGYSCEGKKGLPEDAHIDYVNGEFVATKVHGNECVHAGKTSFKGSLEKSWDTDKEYKCQITIGNIEEPQSEVSDNCKIKIIDQDHFEIPNLGISFKRGRLPPPPPVIKYVEVPVEKVKYVEKEGEPTIKYVRVPKKLIVLREIRCDTCKESENLKGYQKKLAHLYFNDEFKGLDKKFESHLKKKENKKEEDVEKLVHSILNEKEFEKLNETD